MQITVISQYEVRYSANTFELNLVGSCDGKSTMLSSGKGTITYTASNPLIIRSVANLKYTKETSNSIYGVLPPVPEANNTFV
jgi:hypothetical protein